MMPTETIGLVIEKMRKMLSCAIGVAAAGLCRPMASNQPIWPLRATITVAPGRVPLSTSRLKASDSFCRREADSPMVSGLACGSDGVCGLVACLAAVWAFMNFSRWALVGLGEVWRRTYGLNRAFGRFALANRA